MSIPRKQTGAAVVELAILLTPLLVLAFGITEFGRAIYQYNAIAKGVRDGVRHLSQYAPGDPSRVREAQCLVAFGATDCSGPALVPGLTTAQVIVHDRLSDPSFNLQTTGRGAVNLVGVEVAGFRFISMAPLFVPDMAFRPIHATMQQVL